MKISARLSAALSLAFVIFCLCLAFYYFWFAGNPVEAVESSNVRGYAGFWFFLTAIGVFLSAFSWWNARRSRNDKK